MIITGRVISLSMNKKGEKTAAIETKDALYTNLTQTWNIPMNDDNLTLGDEIKITLEKI